MVFEQKCGHVALGTADTSQGHEEVKMKTLPSPFSGVSLGTEGGERRLPGRMAPWKVEEEAPVLAPPCSPDSLVSSYMSERRTGESFQ